MRPTTVTAWDADLSGLRSRDAGAASTEGVRVMLLADLDEVRSPRIPPGPDQADHHSTSTRLTASSLHWMSSSTCWQRMTFRPSWPCGSGPSEFPVPEAGRYVALH